MTTKKQDACDHKFVGSKHCLKCGWVPSAVVYQARLNPMHVVAAPAISPEDRAERSYWETMPTGTGQNKQGFILGYLARDKELSK